MSVDGRIDGAAANDLEVEILAAVKAGAKEIYVNLAHSDFICSAGLRVLLQHFRQMKNQQKVLRVTRPSPNIDSVLEMSGFKSLIVDNIK